MTDHPAAWHPDPFARHQLRYWDGARWTAHVSNAGVTSSDPPFASPAPAAAPAQQPTAQVAPAMAAPTAPTPPPAAAAPVAAPSWTDHALLDDGWGADTPGFAAGVAAVLGTDEWVLTALRASNCYFGLNRQLRATAPWAIVTQHRLIVLTEKGFSNIRYPLVAQWPLAQCGTASYGPLLGAGPTWEVQVSVPNGSVQEVLSIYCFSDPPRSEQLCSAINAARGGLASGGLARPSGRWSISYAASTYVGDAVSVRDTAEVRSALQGRPSNIVLTLSEQSTGRAEFDGPAPGSALVTAAEQEGYRLVGREVFGTPPNHGWMGPGDRTVRLVLERIAESPVPTPVMPRMGVVSVPFTRREYIEIIECLMYLRRSDPARWAQQRFLDLNLTWICANAPGMDDHAEEAFRLTGEEAAEWLHCMDVFPLHDEHTDPAVRAEVRRKVVAAQARLLG
ncbi:MAG: DUF2510 domain-containing protein [Ilumatobacteraceae bacterium]